MKRDAEFEKHQNTALEVVEGGPDRKIMRCLLPLLSDNGVPRAADSASFLVGDRLSINISVSAGCVGRCSEVCPSGLPKTLQPPMFSAEDMVNQVDEHLRLRKGKLDGVQMIDVGTFADGEPASNGDEVLSAAEQILSRRLPYIHHIGISTIGFQHEKFLPKFLALAQSFDPGRVRLHYSFYGPGAVHERFVPKPSPPAEEVLPSLACIGRESGFPVTMNIPMIADQTDTVVNMAETVNALHPSRDAFRVKLSTFHPGEDDILEPTSPEKVQQCVAYLQESGLGVKVFTADKQDDGQEVEAGCGRCNVKTRQNLVKLQLPLNDEPS